LDEGERNQIREETLSLMFEIPEVYQKQFSNAVCLMGKFDFPDKWPQLIQVLSGYLESNDLPKLFAALTTMDELFQRYRHELKTDKLWREIKFVLDNVSHGA
jgi:exportin-2 (importin alpha re-exporter)